METEQIKFIVGNGEISKTPLPAYSDIVCDFLDELSGILRKHPSTKTYPDIMTFAFWCRRANIVRLKEEFLKTHETGGKRHLGRGVVFHIAPSNVPVNFAFSFVFGLLAGCGNIVRVSEKEFAQTEIICGAINQLFEEERYHILRKQNQIVSYGHDQTINEKYSALCDARVIWGGDHTIAKIREAETKPRCVDIAFADRYSFAVFREKSILEKSEEEMEQFVRNFYNDTYLMDQNACSSPHLILWIDPDGEKKGRKRFWKALGEKTLQYDLPEKKVMDKYTLLCEQMADGGKYECTEQYGNRLVVYRLLEIPDEPEKIRGIFGLFFEMEILELSDVLCHLSEKTQTCVLEGVLPEEIMNVIEETHIQGIDRIVPVGKAMDVGVYWDGYDIVGLLSRKICY